MSTRTGVAFLVVRILLTGAAGTIGRETLVHLVDRGHTPVCVEFPSRATKARARRSAAPLAFVYGDLCDEQFVARVVRDCQLVIHNAAIMPPDSEQHPESARQTNVGATTHLIRACEALPSRPSFILASSATVAGPKPYDARPLDPSDPPNPSDHYTRQKVEAEAVVQQSDLRTCIMRFCAVPPVVPPMRLDTTSLLFDPHPQTQIELLHPKDAGLAQANAVDCAGTWGKSLLLGGGPTCRMIWVDWVRRVLATMGITGIPEASFRGQPYYTHFVDSAESRELLRYQTRSASDYLADLSEAVRWRRRCTLPLRPLVRAILLSQGAPRN